MAGKLRDWQVPQAGLGGKIAPRARYPGKPKGKFWNPPSKPSPVRELNLIMMNLDKGTTNHKRRKV